MRGETDFTEFVRKVTEQITTQTATRTTSILRLGGWFLIFRVATVYYLISCENICSVQESMNV